MNPPDFVQSPLTPTLKDSSESTWRQAFVANVCAIDLVLVPILLFALLVDAVCIIACFGLPLKWFGSFLVFTSIVFATLSVLSLIRIPTRWSLLAGLLSVVLIAVASFERNWPQCNVRSSVSSSYDSWNYALFGRHLWEQSRDIISPILIDQKVRGLQYTRYAASSLLAVFSTFTTPGDPASATLLLSFACCLCLFLSIIYLCRSLGFIDPVSVIAGLLCVAIGWTENSVVVANLDNLVFLPLFTALIALIINYARSANSLRQQCLPIVILSSACIFTYPEGFALGMVLAAPLLVHFLKILACRRDWRTFVIIVVSTFFITAPYLPIGSRFLVGQMLTTKEALRPGEGYFPGIIRLSSFPSAIWALGGEYSTNATWHWGAFLISVLLFLLLVVGGHSLLRQYTWFVAAGIPLVALVAWLEFARYDYGIYKVLFMGSFWFFPLIATGLHVVAVCFSPRRLAIGVFAFALTIVVWFVRDDFKVSRISRCGCVNNMSDLASLKFVATNQSVLLDIGDVFSQLWALYYLRDVAVRLQDSTDLADPIRSLVTFSNSARVFPLLGRLQRGAVADSVWTNGSFSVVESREAAITGVQESSRWDDNDKRRSRLPETLWLGSNPISLEVSVPETNSYLLRGEFIIGSRINGPRPHIVQISTKKDSTTIALFPGTVGLPMHLVKGDNTVTLSCTSCGHPKAAAKDSIIALREYYVLAASITLDGKATGGWITNDGITISAPSALLKAEPQLMLMGEHPFYKQFSRGIGIRAQLRVKGKLPVAVQSRMTETAGTYSMVIDLNPLDLPEDQDVQISIDFDNYVIPKDLGLTKDTRRLVVKAPTSVTTLSRGALK